jgi:hypothetical protein
MRLRPELILKHLSGIPDPEPSTTLGGRHLPLEGSEASRRFHEHYMMMCEPLTGPVQPPRPLLRQHLVK